MNRGKHLDLLINSKMDVTNEELSAYSDQVSYSWDGYENIY